MMTLPVATVWEDLKIYKLRAGDLVKSQYPLDVGSERTIYQKVIHLNCGVKHA